MALQESRAARDPARHRRQPSTLLQEGLHITRVTLGAKAAGFSVRAKNTATASRAKMNTLTDPAGYCGYTTECTGLSHIQSSSSDEKICEGCSQQISEEIKQAQSACTWGLVASVITKSDFSLIDGFSNLNCDLNGQPVIDSTKQHTCVISGLPLKAHGEACFGPNSLYTCRRLYPLVCSHFQHNSSKCQHCLNLGLIKPAVQPLNSKYSNNVNTGSAQQRSCWTSNLFQHYWCKMRTAAMCSLRRGPSFCSRAEFVK